MVKMGEVDDRAGVRIVEDEGVGRVGIEGVVIGRGRGRVVADGVG